MQGLVHQVENRIPVPDKLFRGQRRLRIALVGLANSGKHTLFQSVSSTSIVTGMLPGTEQPYEECTTQIGLDEAQLFKLPDMHSLWEAQERHMPAWKFLFWGDQNPTPAENKSQDGPIPMSSPDVIIQVLDATALPQHLELTIELAQLGRPLVLAVNRWDEALSKGLHINSQALSSKLGIPVIATIATMGHGVAELFQTAVNVVRRQICPLPQTSSQYILESLQPLSNALNRSDVHSAFQVPHSFLLLQLAQDNEYFTEEVRTRFPALYPQIVQLRAIAEQSLPRRLPDELHADRHHLAASLFEAATRVGPPRAGRGWRYWLDELFLHPRWGLIGSVLVFAAVLFLVLEISTGLDGMTTAKLAHWVSLWHPTSTIGIIGRGVSDGLVGLVGIVVPYMLPLVLLLVALEEAGIMQRIAFVVDRGFHYIGLHGAVAVPFLLGLGCNVPAISAVANSKTTSGRERIVASLLITFVPCSARSAVILALAGKYLGGLGVFSIFALSILVIALLGNFLQRRFRETGPGQVQEIPPYRMPGLRNLVLETWSRTQDILTIVTPLLVGGSVVLALLDHFGATALINTAFTPITSWWLGLPLALGMPILFGILRKELSLLMIYQALGTFDVSQYLDWVQIMTFLIFLTFYIPCVSTFAVMLRTLGRREATYSIALSIVVALLVSGGIRLILESARIITT